MLVIANSFPRLLVVNIGLNLVRFYVKGDIVRIYSRRTRARLDSGERIFPENGVIRSEISLSGTDMFMRYSSRSLGLLQSYTKYLEA